MYGIVLAFLYAGILCAFEGMGAALAYVHATNFLFWWYVAWSVILSVFMGLFCILFTLGGGLAGAARLRQNNRGPLSMIGFLLGLGGGGALSLLFIFAFAVRRALYVVGAYLLSTALLVHEVSGQVACEWNSLRLVLGGLLILVAILTKSKSSSSSNKES